MRPLLRKLRFVRGRKNDGGAYRRGFTDALKVMRLLLEKHNPCHDGLRREIDRRLELLGKGSE